MEKVIIADITTLHNGNLILGHSLAVSENYLKVLRGNLEIYIAGGKIYSQYFDKGILIILPFQNNNKFVENFIGRIIKKIKEAINAGIVLKGDADTVIFQSYSSLIPILIALLFSRTNSKVFIIQYKYGLRGRLINYLYKKVSSKIEGIICTNSEVGKMYNKKYLVVSDFIYTNPKNNLENVTRVEEKYKYDFSFVGIVSDGKNIEDIVENFNNTNYKVLIAGQFEDIERYKTLIKLANENIEIINKFLEEKTYRQYIKASKYILLPYKDYYNDVSSGVVYDALFYGKPVIASNVKNFEFIKEYNLGYLYEESIREVLDKQLNYNRFIENINKFLEDNIKYKDKLIKFLL